MAATYQSVGVSPGASSTTIVIPKPASLAAGDLMLAATLVEADRDITPPSGFTFIPDSRVISGGAVIEMNLYAKVADASDAAASDFTFTISGAIVPNYGVMFRISGTSTPDVTFDTPTTDTDSASNPLTPAAHTFVDDQELVCVFSGSADLNTWTFTVGGANQTITERVDTNSGTPDLSIAAATIVPDSGQTNLSTGTITADANGSTDVVAVAVLVKPLRNATVNIDPVSISVVMNSPSGDIIQPITPISISVVLNSPTSTAADSEWSNTAKNAATATNVDKHAASFTNVSKSNAPTWTNQNKS